MTNIFHNIVAKESGLVKPVGREELLRWSLDRFPQYKVGTDMKAILPQLMNCVNDKSATVRSLAEQLLGLMFSKKGCKMKDVESAMEKLSASAKRTTSATVQRLFDSTPVEKPAPAPAPGSAPAPAASASSEERGGGAAAAAAASAPDPSPVKNRPPASKDKPTQGLPSSPKSGGSGGSGSTSSV